MVFQHGGAFGRYLSCRPPVPQAHTIKNPKTQMSQAAQKLKAERRWGVCVGALEPYRYLFNAYIAHWTDIMYLTAERRWGVRARTGCTR